VAFLEAALHTLSELPETTQALSDALDIRIALGPALISLHGAAASRVGEVYSEALTLVERLADTSRRFPVMWGLWFISYTLGRYPAARDAGVQLLEDAEAGDDTGRLVEAHHALWPTLLAMGESAAAVPHMERGIALYQRERHASQAFLYAGHDPGACCRYQLALTRWLLGYPDGAVAILGDAQRLADELTHAQTTTITLWMTVAVRLFRGEREAAAETSERLVALADVHGFAHWTDIAIVAPDAAGRVRLDRAALAELHQRLMRVRTAVWRRVLCLCHLADLCLAAGCPEEGRRALATIDQANREAFLAPEIQRLEGELLLLDVRPHADDAERRFRTAIDDARRRSERSLELRAATSLARLLDRQGQREEARRVITGIYGWFTEGFDTADLRDATKLLDQLGTASA
jgi:tetratricopeptide (TPR) repeat protein